MPPSLWDVIWPWYACKPSGDMSMCSTYELKFWQNEAKCGRLLKTIRLRKERAIKFFGADSVLSSDEKGLLATLEAHRIVRTSSPKLKKEMNEPFRFVLKSTDGLTAAAIKKAKKVSFFNSSDVIALKQKAERHLLAVLGNHPGKDQ
jgi:hypothetical protein